jgi:predicted DCC family thiol-disulfide oxidoreductase YuxK
VNARPVVVWDGGCSFCSRSVRVLRALDLHRRLDYQGSADVAALARLGVTQESADEEMKLVEPGGRVSGGYDAIVRIVRQLPLGWLVSPILALPPLRALGRPAYRWIAAHRTCRLH